MGMIEPVYIVREEELEIIYGLHYNLQLRKINTGGR